MSVDVLDLCLEISPQVLARGVQGEMVLLHLGRERYFALNEVGARIWELLAEGLRPRDVHVCLLKEYAVEPNRLRDDLLSLVEELLAADLLRPKAGGSGDHDS